MSTRLMTHNAATMVLTAQQARSQHALYSWGRLATSDAADKIGEVMERAEALEMSPDQFEALTQAVGLLRSLESRYYGKRDYWAGYAESAALQEAK